MPRILLIGASLAALASGAIPTVPLAGGGDIPLLAMGGNDFAGWFEAVRHTCRLAAAVPSRARAHRLAQAAR